jgi:hypothetical protein
MKRHRLAKKWLALLALSGALAIGLGTLALTRWLAKPVIGFYGIPSGVAAALKAEASGKKPGAWKFVTLDPNVALAAQEKALARVTLLFAYDGAAAASLADRARQPAPPLLAKLPSALRRAGLSGEVNYGMAVLLDHFEITWNRAFLNGKGLSRPGALSDVVRVAETSRRPGFWPIVCAGAEDATLLQLVGAMAEATEGSGAYWEIVKRAAEGAPLSALLGETRLKPTLDRLVDWRTRGLLHPEWIRMTEADVVSFMENDYSAFAFMTLSAHRRVPQKTIERYDSAYVPFGRQGDNRSFIAPTLLAIRLDKAAANRAVEALCARLADGATQTALTKTTGLAPTNASAEAGDRQANDARLWVASSQGPLPDIGTAAFADPAKLRAFARSLREYLESGGAAIR